MIDKHKLCLLVRKSSSNRTLLAVSRIYIKYLDNINILTHLTGFF